MVRRVEAKTSETSYKGYVNAIPIYDRSFTAILIQRHFHER